MTNGDKTEWPVVSYLTLRRVVGLLGVSLPALVAVGCLTLGSCTELKESISDYYNSNMGDVFVGVLFTIAWFLFAYRGHERQDDIFGDLACLFALGVAIFPTTSGSASIRTVHFVSAFLLFGVLAYFSLALFTKTEEGGTPTPQKLIRNRVYRICGVTILVCLALIGLYYLLGKPASVASLKPVFWLESIMLWAFGWSWFVKGETLWRDPKPVGP